MPLTREEQAEKALRYLHALFAAEIESVPTCSGLHSTAVEALEAVALALR